MQLANTKITLTSLEIAELTAKRHDNIMRDIDEQLSEVCSLLKFEESYKSENGHTYKMYVLPKRECLILISGYNVKLRASIIDRLQFLEDELKSPQNNISVNVSDSRWRKAFYLGYEGRCFFTGQQLKEEAFHLDHIIPKSRGGQDTLENLVLSSPAVNQSKSDSYAPTHAERNIKDIKEKYAPAVLKHYYELGETLVSKAFTENPQFTNSKFIEKLEGLFGREHVRSLYASLIPGLNADVSEEAYDMGISEFLKDCTSDHLEEFVVTSSLFEAYILWSEQSNITPAGRHIFHKHIKEKHNLKLGRKNVIIDGEQKMPSVFLNLRLVG